MQFDESIDFIEALNSIFGRGSDVVLIGGLANQILGGDHITHVVDFAFSFKRESLKKNAMPWPLTTPSPSTGRKVFRLYGMIKHSKA